MSVILLQSGQKLTASSPLVSLYVQPQNFIWCKDYKINSIQTELFLKDLLGLKIS